MDKQTVGKLIEQAKKFSEFAYCPYSDTPIGACVLTQNGMLFGGCNIENVSLSNSLGAIEVAVCKAVSEGCFNIMAVAVYNENMMPFPTGTERQILREFSSVAQVIISNGKGEIEELNMQELLPFPRDK